MCFEFKFSTPNAGGLSEDTIFPRTRPSHQLNEEKVLFLLSPFTCIDRGEERGEGIFTRNRINQRFLMN
jgi:hypothetical protein